MNGKRAFPMALVLIALLAAPLALAHPIQSPESSTSALTVTVLYAQADASVDSQHPDAAYGDSSLLRVGPYGGCSVGTCGRHALLLFDLTTIPAEADIAAATLELHLLRSTEEIPVTVDLRRVAGPWSENEVTWNTAPALLPPVTDASVDAAGGAVQWDATQIVRGWQNGSFSNHGLGLQSGLPGEWVLSFAATEHGGTLADPRLVITYSLPSATPTPTLLPSGQPDLIVTDLWFRDGSICYQVRNIGDALAPSGHTSRLTIDGAERATDVVEVDLPPGQRFQGCFEHVWACAGSEDVGQVCADALDVVSEQREDNNCRQESWACDEQVPRIISGPTVLDITRNSAVVSWVTDKLADSKVEYGRING